MLLNDKISLFRRYYHELFYNKKDVFDIFLRVKCGGRRKLLKFLLLLENSNVSSIINKYIKNNKGKGGRPNVNYYNLWIKVCQELADKGIRVICAGLDNDFKGEPFSIMPQLLCLAEYVTKLTAICNVCGSNATRTQRIVNGIPASYDDPIIIVGASEAYEPRCRHCHEVRGKIKF